MTIIIRECKMGKKIFYICFVQIFLILFGCASYTVNISTIPADEIEIYIDDKYAVSTSKDGKASVEIKNVPFESEQYIEAKRGDYYGCITLGTKSVSPEMQNVHSVTRHTKDGNESSYDFIYNIVFIVPDKSESTIVQRVVGDQSISGVQTRFKIEAEMMEAGLNDRFEQCRYIVTKDDRKMYKKLDLAGKREFFKKFWKKLDTVPGTEINEFKNAYLGRVGIANKRYKFMKKEGWKTDQGRIFILYGEPSEKEVYSQRTDRKAHEIWHYYHIKGGVQFYFVSTRWVQDMRLVHSTAIDEIYDANWERWLE